jgi:uncharacterized alkaline shock family protein YloU
LLVSRCAIADIVRTATLGSYGVIGLAGSPFTHLLARLGLASPGVRVRQRDGSLSVELNLVVGHGLPIAEVARQVDAAVRHALRRALEREVGTVAIHVEHLRFESSAGRRANPGPKSSEVHASGPGPRVRGGD